MQNSMTSNRPISRWQAFKLCRKGYVSFWVLLILVSISCLAEFIANDKPILVYYNNDFYSPLFFDYPQTVFGGQYPAPTRYQDPEIQNTIAHSGWILWPISRYSYRTISFESPEPFPSRPSLDHFLGTTEIGQDVFAIVLYSFRTSVFFALLLTLGTTLLGFSFGSLLGYYGGTVDLIGQRFIEIWAGLPQFFLLIILSSFLVPQMGWLLLLAIAFGWTPLASTVRSEFLRARTADYVRAAQALGVKDRQIIFRHIFPNAFIATLSHLPFSLSNGVVTLAMLDFLGIGLPFSTPSLGGLLWDGRNTLYAPWIGLSAAAALTLLVFLFVCICEALREIFDPKLRGNMS